MKNEVSVSTVDVKQLVKGISRYHRLFNKNSLFQDIDTMLFVIRNDESGQ
jgi:hypothetical protein